MSIPTEFDDALVEAFRRELARARAKFPDNTDLGFALVEEVGELANALLEHKYSGAPAVNVWSEVVQVMAVAARIATEGEAGMPYRPHWAMFEEKPDAS